VTATIPGFTTQRIPGADGVELHVAVGGTGSPIVLLHGFPQTHLMWRGVAPLLARRFTVVCADLRGYGRSGCPASTPDHAPYAKRAMARDMLAVMQQYFADRNTRQMIPSRQMEAPGRSMYSKSMFMVNRRWELHVWELTGAAATWQAQLERHLAQEPVFAVISGLGGENWAPVHEFCEKSALPCLFPNVEVPVEAVDDFYSIYFSKGVLLEAELIARKVLATAAGPPVKEVHQIYRAGDSGEQAQPTDMALALEELRSDAERNGHAATVAFHGLPIVTVKPASFKRCLANLVSNAARHANAISITGHRDHRYLTVTVDDDGPGIPQQMREEVFKPFLRLDDARNQDEGGTGLGLAIARDIARSHGGDIMLGDSPMGGLRATARIPV